MNDHCDYVYHVSPFSGLGRLRPTGGHKGTQSCAMSRGGVYVAPKFRDALAWYCSFVRHKKNEKNTDRRHRSENGKNCGMPKKPLYYHGATIYKIAVPKGLIKNLWKSCWWEPEYFIPAEMMPDIRIVSTKTYTDTELISLYNRARNKAWESQRGGWDMERIAQKLRTNPAAKAYLAFLEEFRAMAVARDERLQLSAYKDAFKTLMYALSDCFAINKFGTEKPVPIPHCKDLSKMEKTVTCIRQLLNTPKRNFIPRHWQRWRCA